MRPRFKYSRPILLTLTFWMCLHLARPVEAGPGPQAVQPDDFEANKEPVTVTVIATAAAVTALIAGGYALSQWATDNFAVGAVAQKCGKSECGNPNAKWKEEDDGWDWASVTVKLSEWASKPCGTATALAWADAVWGEETSSDVWARAYATADECNPANAVGAEAQAKADDTQAVAEDSAKHKQGEQFTLERMVRVSAIDVAMPSVGAGDASASIVCWFEYEYADGTVQPDTMFTLGVGYDENGQWFSNGGLSLNDFTLIQNLDGSSNLQLSGFGFADTVQVAPGKLSAVPAKISTHVEVSTQASSVLGGPPEMTVIDDETYQDAFAISGIDPTILDPNLSSVRIDTGRDAFTDGPVAVRTDAMDVLVRPFGLENQITGPGLGGGPVLVWILEANPLFDLARQMPPDAAPMGVSPSGRQLWSGQVEGVPGILPHVYGFDLPHEGAPSPFDPMGQMEPAMFFPGDEIRYHLAAEDALGNFGTLPSDLNGFETGDGWPRNFEVHALPSLREDGLGGVVMPPMLIYRRADSGLDASLQLALAQNGLEEGVDYDMFLAPNPAAGYGNGLGQFQAGGATQEQLMGYQTLLISAGDSGVNVLSNGSGDPQNGLSHDLPLVFDWLNQPGERQMLLMGQRVASGLMESGPEGHQLLIMMGLDVAGHDPLEWLPQPLMVMPTGFVPEFDQPIAMHEALPQLGDPLFAPPLGIDMVFPMGESFPTHEFSDGLAPMSPAGCVSQWPHPEGPRTTAWMGLDLEQIADVQYKGAGQPTAAARVLGGWLGLLGVAGGGVVTSNDAVIGRELALQGNWPNPFNPSTTIRFNAPRSGEVQLRIYDTRGRSVRTLLDGVVEAGENAVVWDGRADDGSSVSSGAYYYRVSGFGQTLADKMILAK